MDSFTHALVTYLLFFITANGRFAPYAIVGAVLPDIDFFFKPLSDRDPRLFIFTHGGFTHSIVGVAAVSFLAFLAMVPLSIWGNMGNIYENEMTVFLFILFGSLLHLVLDSLAFPGIPLFYPTSSRKITLGIFPGPSILLMVITIGYLGLVAGGVATLTKHTIYIGICLSVIGIRTVLKIYAASSVPGTTIPTFHPLRWWAIKEEPAAYLISSFQIGGGISGSRRYEKFRGVTEDEVTLLKNQPEFQRHRYYSYFSIIERNGHELIARDPFREEGHVLYPPYYQSITFRDHQM